MYNYLPKFIRKYLLQSGKIILCNNYLKVIQINKEVEMESIEENSDGTFSYEKAKFTWYIHTKELYESYDTYAVISQIQGLIKNGTYKEIKGDE